MKGVNIKTEFFRKNPVFIRTEEGLIYKGVNMNGLFARHKELSWTYAPP